MVVVVVVVETVVFAMGHQKMKWTSDEEEALRAGIDKYGIGRWKNILKDPDFGPSLTSRSNIDLKVFFINFSDLEWFLLT